MPVEATAPTWDFSALTREFIEAEPAQYVQAIASLSESHGRQRAGFA
ncbi:hypothetical protein [Microbacterium gorillae]